MSFQNLLAEPVARIATSSDIRDLPYPLVPIVQEKKFVDYHVYDQLVVKERDGLFDKKIGK